MQRMPKYVWWIIGMLVVLGYLFWVSSYTREVGGEWVGLQKSLIGLDSVIQGAIREDGSLAIDFQDLENSCAGLESIITKLEKQFKRKMVPPGFGGFNSNFVDYLGSSKAAVESVNKNCSTWSKIEMKDLKKKIGSMGDTQLDCVNCWRGIRGLQMREDLFALTPAILNQMHAIKSKPKLPDTGSSSGGGGFVMPTDPFIAGTWVGGGFEPWTGQRYGLKAVFGQNNNGSIRGYFYWSDSSGGGAKEELVGSIDSSGTILVRGIGLENVINPPGHTYSTDTYRAVLSSDRTTIDGNWDKSNMRVGSHFTLRLQTR